MEDKIEIVINEASGEKAQVFNLDEEMNRAFLIYIQKFFKNIAHSRIWNLENYHNLETAIFEYFDRRYLVDNKDAFQKQDYLFNNLTFFSNYFLHNGWIADAQKFLEKVLRTAMDWENSRKNRIHKGSIYYFWAELALFNNEIDKGFFLIHESYREDCETYETINPSTPSQKTISLNTDKENMLFDYVLRLSNFLMGKCQIYNKENNRNLSEKTIRELFLQTPPSNDVLFSFTYALAKIEQLESMQPYVKLSSFTGFYALNILFNLVLVIDNLRYSKIEKPNTRKDWEFSRLIKRLLVNSSFEINEEPINRNLKSVNDPLDIDFGKTINELLDRTFIFECPTNVSPLYFDIILCYAIRNYSAHNISLNETIASRFKEISKGIFNTLFLAIETH